MLLEILLSTILVSLISFTGIVTLSLKKDFIKKIMLILVAFAAGSMLGAAFFDMLPEAFEIFGENTFLYVLLGILIFFIVERYIHWHHCHEEHVEVQPFTYLNLIGDGVHNFIDGAIIAASFLTNPHLGIVSTIAIASHEIPQEIGDFGILIHGGMNRRKALSYNFLSGLLCVIGGLITFFFASSFQDLIPILLSIASGGFIYLALVDIVPDIHKETEMKKIILETLFLFIGIFLMYSLTVVLPHVH